MISRFFRRASAGVATALVLATSTAVVADTVVLTVDYTVGAAIQALWEGGDTVAGAGGDGTITLEPGVAKTAQLKVQCNTENGYSVKFSAAGATGAAASKLKLGAGGTTDTELTYSCALDVTGFAATSNTTVAALHLDTNAEAVHVIFDDLAGSHVLPVDAASANEINLLVTLDTFDAFARQDGLYTDTITAEVTVN